LLAEKDQGRKLTPFMAIKKNVRMLQEMKTMVQRKAIHSFFSLYYSFHRVNNNKIQKEK